MGQIKWIALAEGFYPDGYLKEFDTSNTAAKFPVDWQIEYICPYCHVDYTEVKDSKWELKTHIQEYHKKPIGEQTRLLMDLR